MDNQNDRAELAHYGILGMKWGVRRYQNPDGSLTSEGKKRYSTGETGSKAARPSHEDHTKVFDGKKAHELSDAELRNRLNRLNMEKQYRQLTEEEYNRGKITVRKIIKTVNSVDSDITSLTNLFIHGNKAIAMGASAVKAIIKLLDEDE